MEFETHLEKYLSKQEITALMNSLKEESIRAVLLNTKKMSCEEFINLYPNAKPHPIVKNAFLYSPKEYELGKSIYHELGCFYIQEPSAMVPSFILSPKENETILDLCAAPGGKSIQASFLMNNTGLIISNDLSRSRALAIKENSERLGISNILCISNDFSKIYKNYSQYFDRIILDAPCSGSGMFRKNDAMFNDWSINKVNKFSDIQKELILMCYEMLKCGGTMCYSTCSFSYEEDEEVITHLLTNSDAEIVEIENNPLFYKSNGHGVHLFPNKFPGDGQYICLIKKPGVLNSPKIEYHFSQINLDFPNDRLSTLNFGENLYGVTRLIKTNNLSLIRYGVKIGEFSHDKIKYDVHFARYLADAKNRIDLSLEQTKSYIKGETLNIQVPKGDYLLLYKNKSVDIAHSDGRIIKNSYPKYLRKNIN